MTQAFAQHQQLRKAHLVVQLDSGVSADESKRPGIGRLTGRLLDAVEAAIGSA